MLILIIVFIMSLFLFIFAISKNNKYLKYEFENKSDGGVVQFQTYGQSTKHQMKKNFIRMLGGLSFFVGFFSAAILIIMMMQG